MSRKKLVLITIMVTLLAAKGLAFEIRPQDASGYPGETVTVSINVVGATKTINALGMDLVYDSTRLSFENLSKAGLTANYYLLDPYESEPGKLRIGGFGVNVPAPSDTTTTTLVNLNFKIKEEASGYGPISLSDFVADLEGATTAQAKVTIYSAEIPDTPTPAPPCSFDLLFPENDGWISDPLPTFSWNPSFNLDDGSGIAYYYLYLNGALNKSPTTNSTKPSASLSGGSYTWRVEAENSQGKASSSDIWTVKIDLSPPDGPPLAPLDQGDYSTSKTIEFTLRPDGVSDLESGILSYRVEVSTNEGIVSDTEVIDTSLSISSCEEGKTYFARVRAKNRAGLCGEYSQKSNGITIDTISPDFLNGYFDSKNEQVVLHFSERIKDPVKDLIKVDGTPLANENISETEGGKTLTISVHKADSIELGQNCLKDIAGNSIKETSQKLYLLAGTGEEVNLGIVIENRSDSDLAFRCKDKSRIDTGLCQKIEDANEKAEADPKISKMIGAAYQIEAITPEGEDCGENLGGLILLEIPYEEEDDNENLRAYRLNEESSKWELIEDGGINEPDRSNKVVKVEVAHFSVISLGIAKQAAPDLTGAKVFPNPFIPGSAVYGALKITFSGLTLDAEIKIFTIAGELVKTLNATNGEAAWDATNENKREVASGSYIYLITDSQDRKKTGKIVIIK